VEGDLEFRFERHLVGSKAQSPVEKGGVLPAVPVYFGH
jgi:hypothetical protein